MPEPVIPFSPLPFAEWATNNLQGGDPDAGYADYQREGLLKAGYRPEEFEPQLRQAHMRAVEKRGGDPNTLYQSKPLDFDTALQGLTDEARSLPQWELVQSYLDDRSEDKLPAATEAANALTDALRRRKVAAGELPFAKVRKEGELQEGEDPYELIAGDMATQMTPLEALKASARFGGVRLSDAFEADQLLAPAPGTNGKPRYVAERQDRTTLALSALAKTDPAVMERLGGQALRQTGRPGTLGYNADRFSSWVTEKLAQSGMMGDEAEIDGENRQASRLRVQGFAEQDEDTIAAALQTSLVASGMLDSGDEPRLDDVKAAATRLADEYAMEQGFIPFDAENLGNNIRLQPVGGPVIHPALYVNPETFAAALAERPELKSSEKKHLEKSRQHFLARNFDRYDKVLSDSPDQAAAWTLAKQQGYAAKTPKHEILQEFVKDPENYSAFAMRAKGIGASLVDSIGGAIAALPALMGNEAATGYLLESDAKASARRALMETFGDPAGIWQDVGEAIAPAIVDVGLTALISAGATPLAGGGYLAAKRGAGMTLKGLGKAITSNILRTSDDISAEMVAKRLAVQGLLKTKDAPVTEIIKGFNEILDNSVTQALGRGIAAGLPAANRAGGATYATLYAAMPDDLTHEQKHDRALGGALTSAAVNFLGTGAFSAIGRGGLEDAFTKGASYRQMKDLYASIANRKLSDATFNEVLKKQVAAGLSTVRKGLLKNTALGVADEFLEEGAIEFVDSFVEDAALNQDTPMAERWKRAGHAALVGGILGGGVEAVKLGGDYARSAVAPNAPMSRATRNTLRTVENQFINDLSAKLESTGSPLTAEAIRQNFARNRREVANMAYRSQANFNTRQQAVADTAWEEAQGRVAEQPLLLESGGEIAEGQPVFVLKPNGRVRMQGTFAGKDAAGRNLVRRDGKVIATDSMVHPAPTEGTGTLVGYTKELVAPTSIVTKGKKGEAVTPPTPGSVVTFKHTFTPEGATKPTTENHTGIFAGMSGDQMVIHTRAAGDPAEGAVVFYGDKKGTLVQGRAGQVATWPQRDVQEIQKEPTVEGVIAAVETADLAPVAEPAPVAAPATKTDAEFAQEFLAEAETLKAELARVKKLTPKQVFEEGKQAGKVENRLPGERRGKPERLRQIQRKIDSLLDLARVHQDRANKSSESVPPPQASKPDAQLSPEESAALRITALKGVENRGDGIFFIPEKLMTPERRKAVKRGGRNVEVKAWADVTGDPADRGYAILDRRARMAARASRSAPVAEPPAQQPATPTLAELVKDGLPKGTTGRAKQERAAIAAALGIEKTDSASIRNVVAEALGVSTDGAAKEVEARIAEAVKGQSATEAASGGLRAKYGLSVWGSRVTKIAPGDDLAAQTITPTKIAAGDQPSIVNGVKEIVDDSGTPTGWYRRDNTGGSKLTSMDESASLFFEADNRYEEGALEYIKATADAWAKQNPRRGQQNPTAKVPAKSKWTWGEENLSDPYGPKVVPATATEMDLRKKLGDITRIKDRWGELTTDEARNELLARQGWKSIAEMDAAFDYHRTRLQELAAEPTPEEPLRAPAVDLNAQIAQRYPNLSEDTRAALAMDAESLYRWLVGRAPIGTTLEINPADDPSQGYSMAVSWAEGNAIRVDPVALYLNAMSVAQNVPPGEAPDLSKGFVNQNLIFAHAEAVMAHELGHIAGFEALTDEEVADMASKLKQADFERVIEDYYPDEEGKAQALADLADTETTNPNTGLTTAESTKRMLAEEWSRMWTERVTRGYSQEEWSNFLRGNPSRLRIAGKYLGGVFRAMANRLDFKRNYNSTLHAYLNRVSSEMRLLRAGYRLGMPVAGFDANNPAATLELMKMMLRNDNLRPEDLPGGVRGDVLRSPSPAFYSSLERTVEAKLPARFNAQQAIATIEKADGVKAEELKWTGYRQLVERLASESKDGKINKADLTQALAAEGRVEFEEVRLGGAAKSWTQADINRLEREAQRTGSWESYERAVLEYEDQQLGSNANDTNNQTKFGQYQLPGGENYREVVLAMPLADKGKVTKLPGGYSLRPRLGGRWGVFSPDNRLLVEGSSEQDATDKGVAYIEKDRLRFPGTGAKPEYTSSHFPDIPNYVAHYRANDRVDADGKPGLFLEELQSDRHQAGREKGYKEPRDTSGWTARKKPGVKRGGPIPDSPEMWEINDAEGNLVNFVQVAVAPSETDAIKKSAELLMSGGQAGVADAPFRKDWPLQLFKRALREAVATRKEWVGWTVGETQNDRYDLSKQVDEIRADRRATGTDIVVFKDGSKVVERQDLTDPELVDLIGKDMAEKIANQTDLTHSYSGLDLKVGGSGMKGFYDTMLPKEIGKYVKQWGAVVEKGEVGRAGSVKDTQGNEITYGRDTVHPIWRVDITPTMRASVASAGQPLFSPSSLRHAALEEKHNAGTITPAEVQEAGRLVEERAKGAGYNVSVWQGVKGGGIQGNTYNPKFIGRYNDSPLSKVGYMFSTEQAEASRYGKPQRFYLRTNRVSEQTSLAGGTWSAKQAVEQGFDALVWRNTTDASDTPSDIYLIAPGHENNIKSAENFTGTPLDERFDPQQDSILRAPVAMDAAYLQAVNSGDMATAQRMVDAAAKGAGYNVGPVWHGSPNKGFTVFDRNRKPRPETIGRGFFFTSQEDFSTYFHYSPEQGRWDGESRKFYLRGNFESLTENDATLGAANENDVLERAKRRGFDGVLFEKPSVDFEGQGENYVVFNPSQIKSADPVTYDEQGKVIPLSQRFNPESDSILRAPVAGFEKLPDMVLTPLMEMPGGDPKAPGFRKPVGTFARWIQGETDPRLLEFMKERDRFMTLAGGRVADFAKNFDAGVKEIYGNDTPDWALIARAAGSDRVKAGGRATITDMDWLQEQDALLAEALRDNDQNETIDEDTRVLNEEAIKQAHEDKLTARREWEWSKLEADRNAAMAELAKLPGSATLTSTLLTARTKVLAPLKQLITDPIGGEPDLDFSISNEGDIYITKAYKFFQLEGYAEMAKHHPDLLAVREGAAKFMEKSYVHQRALNLIKTDKLSRAEAKRRAEEELLISNTGHTVSMGQHMLNQWLEEMGGVSPQASNTKFDSNFMAVVNNLKTKADMPDPLAQVLGTYNDTETREKMLRTILVVHNMAANQVMLRQMRALGEKEGFMASKDVVTQARAKTPLAPTDPDFNPDVHYDPANFDPTKEGRTAYAGWEQWPNRKDNNDLFHDLFAPQEVITSMAAVNEAMTTTPNLNASEQATSALFRASRWLTGVSMGAKTLGSLGFYTRNIVSNAIFFPLIQGLTPLSGYAPGGLSGSASFYSTLGTEAKRQLLRRDSRSEQEIKEELEELTLLGIAGNEMATGIMRDLLKGTVTPKGLIAQVDALTDAKALKIGKEGFKKLMELAKAASVAVDAFYKFAYYKHEVGVMFEARAAATTGDPLLGATDMELKKLAATKVRMTAQTASETLPLIKSVERSAIGTLFAPFLRFKSEVPRILVNTWRLAQMEYKSGNEVLVRRGRQRIQGLIAASTISTLFPIVAAIAAGMWDEEEEAMRDSVPVYLRNNSFLFWRGKDGGWRSTDWTFVNPVAMFADPLARLLTGIFTGRPAEGGVDFAKALIFDQYLDDQILAGAVNNLRANEDPATGKPIWEANDSVSGAFVKAASFLIGDAFAPMVGKKLWEGWSAIGGDHEGFLDSPAGIVLASMAPTKIHKVDLNQQYSRYLRERKEEYDRVRGQLGRLMSSKPMTEAAIIDLYDDVVKGTRAVNHDMLRKMRGMEGLGLSRNDIYKIMVDNGVSKNRVNLLRQGVMDRPVLSTELMERMRAHSPITAARLKTLQGYIPKANARYLPLE